MFVRRFFIFSFIAALLYGMPSSYAEPIPEYALQKDFQNCMGEDTPQTNQARAGYCNCVINKMRSWDLDTYGEVATEQAKNPTNTDKVSEKIGELAKECLAQALGAPK